MNRGQFILSLLALASFAGLSFGAQIAELEVGRAKAAVVYPEHYLKDPGVGFPLVMLSDVEEASGEVQALADAYKEAVFVCAGTADRTQLLAELSKDPRLFAFPRGRIEISSKELAAADVGAKLKTYFRWGRYQAETPALTRYGARIYRAERTDTDEPTITVPAPWKVVAGDPGETGCDARLAYFTVEADGESLPPPSVAVSWPGVRISSVDGARDVRMTDDGVMLTPTDISGGTNYVTMVREGAIELALHHHVEGAQHGPYAGRPLPLAQIRASDNWRAALRAAFKDAGLDSFAATDGAAVNLYGFDSNFPRRHVDYPEHFHVMLMWDDWRKNNVGHYTLDEKGFIRGNNFLVCGDIAGGLTRGYHPQKPGETTMYVGPSGRPLFSLEMLEDGAGLVLRKPGSDAAWRMTSDRPSEFVELSVRESDAADWTGIGRVSVADDTEAGRYEIRRENAGSVATQVFRYERDTGALKNVSSTNAFVGISLLLPQEGAVVSLLTDGQRGYLSTPTDRRVEKFDDPLARARLASIGWVPAPVVFAWDGVDWDANPGVLEICRESDGRVVRREDVSPRTRNVFPVYNLESGTAYSWRVCVAGRVSPWGHFRTEPGPRLLSVEGVPNFRDLGGRAGLGGRMVRQGVLYRSACANRTSTTNVFPGAMLITEKGRNTAVGQLGIKTDLDLRGDKECRGLQTSPFGCSVKWMHVPSGCYHWMTNSFEKDAVAKCFRIVNNPENLPLVFHCISGQDRTGTLAFILNALLGVSEPDLSLDWEMSVFFNPATGWFSRKLRYEVMLRMFDEAFEGATLQDKVEQYVLSCGVSREEIMAFREKMLCEQKDL